MTAPCPPPPSPGRSTSSTTATSTPARPNRHQERHVHDPDQRSRLQRQHPLPDHAHGHRLERSERHALGADLSAKGESLLQHGAGGPHPVSRRNRQDDTVCLRHADRLQPYGRGPQPGLGRDVVHVRVVVGRRRADAYDRRAGGRSELRRHLPGERGAAGDRGVCVQRGVGDDGCGCFGEWADGHADERGDAGARAGTQVRCCWMVWTTLSSWAIRHCCS